MKETIGWIGLGAMGSAMAGNLLKAGFGLRVYNRTPEKAKPLVEKGATLAQRLPTWWSREASSSRWSRMTLFSRRSRSGRAVC